MGKKLCLVNTALLQNTFQFSIGTENPFARVMLNGEKTTLAKLLFLFTIHWLGVIKWICFDKSLKLRLLEVFLVGNWRVLHFFPSISENNEMRFHEKNDRTTEKFCFPLNHSIQSLWHEWTSNCNEFLMIFSCRTVNVHSNQIDREWKKELATLLGWDWGMD